MERKFRRSTDFDLNAGRNAFRFDDTNPDDWDSADDGDDIDEIKMMMMTYWRIIEIYRDEQKGQRAYED
uniref:Uncharacterized protein n=1 Tax=Setaria digitata TaxID=48799 RepID=A0A915Q674_9BILA